MITINLDILQLNLSMKIFFHQKGRLSKSYVVVIGKLCHQLLKENTVLYKCRFPDPQEIVNGTLAGCFDPVGVQEGSILLHSLLLKLKTGAN